jgi:hypothetical protein
MPASEIIRIAALFGINLLHMSQEDYTLLEHVLDTLSGYYPTNPGA